MARQKGADELFCRSCGDTIKKRAEICPSCGVRNTAGGSSTSTASTRNASGSSDDTIEELAPIVAWAGGILIVLMGIGTIAEPEGQLGRAVISSVLLIATGLFCLPAVRDELATRNQLELSRGLVVTVVLVGLVVAVAIGPS